MSRLLAGGLVYGPRWETGTRNVVHEDVEVMLSDKSRRKYKVSISCLENYRYRHDADYGGTEEDVTSLFDCKVLSVDVPDEFEYLLSETTAWEHAEHLTDSDWFRIIYG